MENTITILVVDDNPGDIKLIIEMLKEAGSKTYTTMPAGSIAEAINILKDFKFDVIFLDFNLPDNIEFGGLDKISMQYPDTPVIVLTGLDNEAVGLKALQKQASDYLVKGQVNPALLARCIQYSIERKKKEIELRRLN